MNSSEKPETTTEPFEDKNEELHSISERDPGSIEKHTKPNSQSSNFDWAAVGIVIVIAAFFSLTARLHAQPSTSFVPAVVVSATGCGLLITAIRKLRTPQGIGLREAALSGFIMALLQFVVALTYPGIIDSILSTQVTGNDFLITWALIACSAIIFSLAGALLGHLSFAPQRPLPSRSLTKIDGEEEKVNIESESNEGERTADSSHNQTSVDTSTDKLPSYQSQRSILSYALTIVLLGLAPTVTAYLFSAAYDFILSFNQFVPGPYPTLRILSALLPWQIPIPIDLNSLNGAMHTIIIFSLLWRIPLFLGNPSFFDLQALEAYIFNGAALALLLLPDRTAQYRANPGWAAYLLMEAALGLILVLPANLWVMRGLEGLIQFHSIVVPIRTISILNPLTFTLNLITGPLVCVILGIVLRIFLSKRII